jgi:hypothetical protein
MPVYLSEEEIDIPKVANKGRKAVGNNSCATIKACDTTCLD